MTTRAAGGEAELSYRLLEMSDEAVTRSGGADGQPVDTPSWFDVQLAHPAMATEVVLSVAVDPERGPVITGMRAGRASTASYGEVNAILKDGLAAMGWSMADLLQVLTALAAGSLTTGRLLEPVKNRLDITDENLTRIGALRDALAGRAYPAVRPQRRRSVTRDLLREVADIYRKAHAAGEPPTVAVAEHFTVSHRTATRWVAEARRAGELGPAPGTKAGELTRDDGASGDSNR